MDHRWRLRSGVVIGVLVLGSACGSSSSTSQGTAAAVSAIGPESGSADALGADTTDTTDTAAADTAEGEPTEGATADDPAPADADLPVMDLMTDETSTAPSTIAQAMAQSDIVVVGTVVGTAGGRRLYGSSAEDPSGIGDESITLEVQVEQLVKGDVADAVEFGWPAYFTTGSTPSDRVGITEYGGVVIGESSIGLRALWFLRDYGEPWGLTTVSAHAGMIELDADDTATGQRSLWYRDLDGASLDTILQAAGAGG